MAEPDPTGLFAGETPTGMSAPHKSPAELKAEGFLVTPVVNGLGPDLWYRPYGETRTYTMEVTLYPVPKDSVADRESRGQCVMVAKRTGAPEGIVTAPAVNDPAFMDAFPQGPAFMALHADMIRPISDAQWAARQRNALPLTLPPPSPGCTRTLYEYVGGSNGPVRIIRK